MYALRKDDLQPATRRRASIASGRCHVRGVYARRENGKIKVGHLTDGMLSDVFWTAPGDKVVEAYIQAKLHLMGLTGTRHTTRMSEWFVTDLTTDELISLLTRLQHEARQLDQRWKHRQ